LPSRTERCAVGEMDEQRSRRLDILGDVPIHHHTHRRYPVILDDPGDQPHGLLADRSTGCQEHGIDAIGFQPSSNDRRELADQLAGLRQIAHEAVHPWIETTDHTRSNEL
jgi:hypothetical protein